MTPADWMLPVGAELAAALAEPDPAARLAPLLGPVAERLEHGRGFVLLRGLPLEKLAAPEAALLALGQGLGTPLPQDATGRLVGMLAGPGAASGGPARFHADPADAVALLCLQQAREGGEVTLVSAPALHNALMKSDRAALATLHQPFPHLGAEAPLPLPVFSTASGAFVGRYDRESMLETALEPAQLAALAALDDAAAAPGQALTIPLHAGDLLLHNPHLVWKRVAAGEAPPPEEAVRQLLRLWLALPGSRALPESFRAVFGETAAGAPRGGVATPPGLVGG
ncbi:TauD/TfdA family dioxygenase [Siccirubricoccus sp. KC 17139]|uniref:TauD/TfdA family dioxygenase n=1 Tax=Siccirubricoccus soli TaxID=2899147 RepID=A0ABT1CZ38_9PROT|nr:TauD/TfdA family dioxygenase [Siccirubricoccus soli]MCO6414938.1 TauD/TfdA family dioxygenase [Siccirubricoccus soli]MCP2681069.1 TauD/TfdA family dioxygenase [Siccirubricoccus soli]